MRIPDLSIIEKTLDNEATPEEAREVVRWFKTPEGQAWLAKRMDMDEKAIHMGQEEEWIDHPVPSAVMYQRIVRQLHRQRIRNKTAYAPASSPAHTPSYCVCGSHFDTGGLVYRSFHAC